MIWCQRNVVETMVVTAVEETTRGGSLEPMEINEWKVYPKGVSVQGSIFKRWYVWVQI